jgi:hypothetical protein
VKVNVRVQVLRGLEALKVEVVGPVKVKVNMRVQVLRGLEVLKVEVVGPVKVNVKVCLGLKQMMMKVVELLVLAMLLCCP